MAGASTRKSRVTVQAMLTVVSSTPVEPGRSHLLTPLDHVMGLHTLHAVYYYKAPSSSGAMEFDRLSNSLCELLSLYPTVTGRLSRDNQDGEAQGWQVRFTDAGVRVLKAKVGATLDEWLRTADLEEETDLTVMDDLPPDPQIWSPFRIQMNEFECGGLAIGLSCTHLLADPTCISLFFKSWAESHRGEPIAHPPFILPSALHRPPAAAKSASYYASKAAAREEIPPSNWATATFSFTDQSVRQQLLKIRPGSPDASPFDLLTALFWSRIVRLNSAPGDGQNRNKFHSLSICVDFRKRLRSPLPYGYFGNALFFSQLTLDGEDLGFMADAISRHVAELEEEEFWAALGWLESRKDEKGEPFKMYGPQLTCINMEDLTGRVGPPIGEESGPMLYASAYEKDRKGKPVHVSYSVGNIGGVEGLIFVMPSPEEGMGRRVKVVLEEELVAKLCEDEVIRSLEPAMLISGGK